MKERDLAHQVVGAAQRAGWIARPEVGNRSAWDLILWPAAETEGGPFPILGIEMKLRPSLMAIAQMVRRRAIQGCEVDIGVLVTPVPHRDAALVLNLMAPTPWTRAREAWSAVSLVNFETALEGLGKIERLGDWGAGCNGFVELPIESPRNVVAGAPSQVAYGSKVRRAIRLLAREAAKGSITAADVGRELDLFEQLVAVDRGIFQFAEGAPARAWAKSYPREYVAALKVERGQGAPQ